MRRKLTRQYFNINRRKPLASLSAPAASGGGAKEISQLGRRYHGFRQLDLSPLPFSALRVKSAIRLLESDPARAIDSAQQAPTCLHRLSGAEDFYVVALNVQQR